MAPRASHILANTPGRRASGVPEQRPTAHTSPRTRLHLPAAPTSGGRGHSPPSPGCSVRWGPVAVGPTVPGSGFCTPACDGRAAAQIGRCAPKPRHSGGDTWIITSAQLRAASPLSGVRPASHEPRAQWEQGAESNESRCVSRRSSVRTEGRAGAGRAGSGLPEAPQAWPALPGQGGRPRNREAAAPPASARPQ